MAAPVFDTYAGAPADFALGIAVLALAVVVVANALILRKVSRILRDHVLTHAARIADREKGKRLTQGRHIGPQDIGLPTIPEIGKMINERHYVGDGCAGDHQGTAEAFGLSEGESGPAGARHG